MQGCHTCKQLCSVNGTASSITVRSIANLFKMFPIKFVSKNFTEAVITFVIKFECRLTETLLEKNKSAVPRSKIVADAIITDKVYTYNMCPRWGSSFSFLILLVKLKTDLKNVSSMLILKHSC
jgi:hypothetical protein